MIRAEQLADRWVNARLTPTNGFDFRLRTFHLVHVGGRPADVADDALEFGILRHLLNFFQHRVLTPRLNRAPLVRRDRAERTSAETTPHDRDRVLDHLVGRDRFRVTGMGPPGER